MKQVLVIGGGAAGMMAALQAAECGASVVLLEKNEKLGKKIYITGKGRCNVTNDCSREDFFDHVVRNPRFLYSSFDSFDSQELQDYLRGKGLSLKTERGSRVFPVSDKSSDVIRTLKDALERAGVEIRLHTEVKALWLEEIPENPTEAMDVPADHEKEGKKGKRPKKQKQRPVNFCRGVILADGRKMPADRVIVATGGLSYASTGSTGDGYRFAGAAGHSVTECYPSLVPFDALIGGKLSCTLLQGLALRNIGIRVLHDGKCLAEDFGELLFTHFGVSGPVMLTASSRITESLQHVGNMQLLIDLKPALTEEQLDARLLRELTAGANKRLRNLAGSLYPAKLIPVILQMAELDPEACGREITREQRTRLVQITKAFPVTLMKTRGFAEAVITRGGVCVQEIDPKTMESKRTENLYFAGEVLDVDAFTGGFNLQIAWSTGAAAGRAAAAE